MGIVNYKSLNHLLINHRFLKQNLNKYYKIKLKINIKQDFFGLIRSGLKPFGNASIDSCDYSHSLLQYALRIKYYCLNLF